MSDVFALEAVFTKLRLRLQAEYPGLIELCPFERYATLLDRRRPFCSYSSTNSGVAALCSEIVRAYSSSALGLYHCGLLLYLLVKNADEMQSVQYSKTVQQLFKQECQRIIREAEQSPIGFYDYSEDLFCKDLAIASLRMFPAGVLKTEAMAGIPRSIVFSNKGRDLLRWFSLISEAGGFNPYYEIHLDIRYREKFTPEGWDNALRVVAEMLQLQPQIKGITGASWFFDPRIKDISPRLTYLRQSVEDNGGHFLFYSEDAHTTELAISSSPTRQKLYLAGSYNPVSYFMVWPRANILQWVKDSGRAIDQNQL